MITSPKNIFYSLLLTVAAVLTSNLLFAQDDQWVRASPSSEAYHNYRLRNSVPPYGLSKVKALIANTKVIDKENDSYITALDNKSYLSLSTRERFTYHMIHAENSSQNCDVVPPILKEDFKIFGNLPDAFGEESWSERQDDFMVSNRDSVLKLITESVERSKRVGLNYKTAIVLANGKQIIPFLIKIYNLDHKDRDLLTVLMLLMKRNEYKPFLTSASYVKLYGLKSDYRSFIDYNKANEDLIISRAMDFYNGLK